MGLFAPDFSHLDSMSNEEFDQLHREETSNTYELSLAYDTPKGPEFVSVFYGPDLKHKET